MPFDAQQFLEVFARYNTTVFPAQIILLIAGLLALRLASNGDSASTRIATAIVAFLWLWIGIVYHWLFFSSINPLAIVFGATFVLQSAVIVYAGVIGSDLLLSRGSGAQLVVGNLLVFYALIVYPMIGIAVGHEYPYTPTFGLPCPTTIFTFGVLLRSGERVPFYLLPIPLLWSFVGFSGALLLGMSEDLLLLPVSLIATGLLVANRIQGGYDRRAAA